MPLVKFAAAFFIMLLFYYCLALPFFEDESICFSPIILSPENCITSGLLFFERQTILLPAISHDIVKSSPKSVKPLVFFIFLVSPGSSLRDPLRRRKALFVRMCKINLRECEKQLHNHVGNPGNRINFFSSLAGECTDN